jgi:2-(3-amino-3-carboxypropyl)histidine synthase
MKLTELQEKYNLELDKIISEIKKEKAKKVLVQLPDGLKPYATAIVDYLKDKTNAELVIWLGSCFGACDVPQIDKDEFDLIVQFGHAPWK